MKKAVENLINNLYLQYYKKSISIKDFEQTLK